MISAWGAGVLGGGADVDSEVCVITSDSLC